MVDWEEEKKQGLEMEVLFSDIQSCVISHLRSAQKSVRVAEAFPFLGQC